MLYQLLKLGQLIIYQNQQVSMIYVLHFLRPQAKKLPLQKNPWVLIELDGSIYKEYMNYVIKMFLKLQED